MSEKKPTLLLVDGNALLYRSYFAFPKELTTPTGELIGAVYGFARVLMAAIKTLKPECVAVAFDLSGPTFRHKQYEAYKATRQKMPEELSGQIDRVHQMVEAMEVPIYTAEDFEADDVIGTLARQADGTAKVVILTGDQDIIQLVNDYVTVYAPQAKGPALAYSPKSVEAKYGFAPGQMVEYKALRGDPSDNIPGVPGVGEVTAKKLIQQFGGIEKMYEELKKGEVEGVSAKMREKLLDGEKSARLSRELATIRTDAPVELDIKHCGLSLEHPEKLLALFQELGFKSLIHELPQTQRLSAHAADIFEKADGEPIPASTKEPENESEEFDAALAPVLRAMEARGVKVDLPYLKKLEHEFTEEIAKLKDKLVDVAGQPFNPDSPAQVGHILYEVMHLPTDMIRKGKTGYTTDAATLQGFAKDHKIAQLLLDYRAITKLQSTYVLPLQGQADDEARIHTSYAPDTATGRISSRNPNLQNIPGRTEQGQRIRRAFVAEKGCQLLSADYSQMELRIAAHLSQDPAMIEAFKEGRDFHAETAQRMGVDRHVAKALNFSILYGKGAFGFAQDFGVTVPEAQQYIEQYFKTYSKLREYLDDTLKKGREQGYLESMFGRRRLFPDLASSIYRLRAAAEREALNMPIQSSQADILKKAMIELDERLQKEKLESRMILTVHDELVLECPHKELKAVEPLVQEVMKGAVTLSVPVEVNVKTGSNWSEMA